MADIAESDPRARVIARIDGERAFWRELVDEVGVERMLEPGPMGEWTFKDLAAHLLSWRERTLGRLEAAVQGREPPPPPWPVDLQDGGGDDPINDWIHERYRERSIHDVLAEMDHSFERLGQAVAALPQDIPTRPEALPWLGGESFAETDLFSHLHDEHMPSVRTWLATRPATTKLR